jgi:hypothetical protein
VSELVVCAAPISTSTKATSCQIFLQELTIKGSFSQALGFIEQGRVTLDKIVSDQLPLSEYGKSAG